MNIATWIREGDEALFNAAFRFSLGVRLANARREKVDAARTDALLLTGGEDVSAAFLNQAIPNPSPIQATDPARDAWEFDALARFFDLNRPILAICRGHQVLNVARGGTLLLDIPGHNLPGQRDQEVQPLAHEPGVPPDRRFLKVNSSHHQAIDKPGQGFEIEARCADDGVIEQVRHRGHPWCVGVQYHPERADIYASLFRSFIEAMR